MLRELLSKCLNGLASAIGAGPQALSMHQRQYLSNWRDELALRVTRNYAQVMAPIYLIAALLEFLAPQNTLNLVISFAFIGMSINAFGWILLERSALIKKSKAVLVQYCSSFLIGTIAFGYCLYKAMSYHVFELADYFIVGLIWMTYLWCIVLGTSITRLKTAIFLIFGAGLTAIIYILSGVQNAASVVWLVVFFSVCFFIYYYLKMRRDERYALLELSRTELAAENQSLKLRALEGELHVAKALHESMVPPPQSVILESCRVDFFHVPYGILGGDWVAARALSDGTWVIAVADVTGKGVSAALVVQAIQSLWAAQLTVADFDPIKWLSSINKTLCLMGRGESHTMTIGLLVLGQDTVTYYSAGHVPVYVVQDIHNPRSVSRLVGQGLPLGVAEPIQVLPITIPLNQDTPYVLLLATDGVLDWQTRRRDSKVFELMTNVINEGAGAIARHKVDDDKILVMIRSASCFASDEPTLNLAN